MNVKIHDWDQNTKTITTRTGKWDKDKLQNELFRKYFSETNQIFIFSPN